MTVRPAVPGDLPRIFEIYAAAREYMKRTGNPTQWGDSKPLPEDVEADVRLGRSRVVCDGDGSGGVFACAVDCCKKLCDNLRIDTHENNSTMRHLVAKHGFVRCGIIHLADGSPRIAYQWTRQNIE